VTAAFARPSARGPSALRRHLTRHLARPLVAALAALGPGLAGCGASPKLVCNPSDLSGCRVENVRIDAGPVPAAELEERLATRDARHVAGEALGSVPLLGSLDALTLDYDRFDRFVLERDLQRLERLYRARGYYDAHVRAGRVRKRPDGHVDVEIVVEPGLPVRVASVEVVVLDPEVERGPLPVSERPTEAALARDRVRTGEADVARLTRIARRNLERGALFDEAKYDATKRSLVRALSERGHAYAVAEAQADVDLGKHEAKVVFRVERGPKCVFGKLELVRPKNLPEGMLRDAAGLREGELFSPSRLEDVERGLAELGVAGTIEVRPVLSPPGTPKSRVVPVRAVLTPAPQSALRFGVGGELGGRAEIHALAGWENKNLFGGLRKLVIEARPGLVFYPTRLETLFDAAPTDVLPELRTRLELRQPMPFDVRTHAVLRGAFNLYRLQTTENQLTSGSELNVYGYREYAGAIGVERTFFRSVLHAGLFYDLQLNEPFSYNTDTPPSGFSPLVLSYLHATLALDLRRDLSGRLERVAPRKGFYAAIDGQLAGHFLPGDVSDVRLRSEARFYAPLGRHLTLATRASVGLLVPESQASLAISPEGCTGLEGDAYAACESALGRALQRLQFRAFFTGGATTNRGYGYNGVGPRAVIPALFLPGATTEQTVPIGGLTLWEAALELRFPISGAVGGVFFLESSDLTAGLGELRFDAPHLSTGLGLRYATPFGPLRADLGLRVPCMQRVGVCDEAAAGLGSPPTLLGLPLAFSIAVGEAY
jgi:outer membrane translocation and assembly module TamA